MSEAELTLLTQIRQAGLPEPVREYVFSDRKFRFDFSWPDIKLAFEVEGGGWSGGRHTSGVGFRRDMEKYNLALSLGWRVYRVDPAMINSEMALELVKEALKGGREWLG